jgi:protein-tyrosine phosphatase
MFSRIFGLGKKNKETAPGHTSGSATPDWSFLGTDIHSHLVPGIDDGAQTVEDSIELIQRLIGSGFKSIVTTPHIKSDHFPNSVHTITEGLKQLHAALLDAGIDIPVKAAAEYYIDEHFMELLEKKELLTIRNNEVLVEMSFMFEPMNLHNILFEIQTSGYRPIMAHPERYGFYHNNYDAFRDLKNKGCLLQLNTISLSGYYGKQVKLVAERLLSDRLYDYCGTDMHHIKHADALDKVFHSDIYKELRDYPFLNKQL